MSRALKETSQFKTDKKHIKRSGRHDWESMRHVEPDWLLIYDKSGDLKT